MRAYGYDKNQVVEREAAIIRELADRILLGETLWTITADLHRRAVATAQGGQWAPSTVRLILRNPRIAGLPTGVRETRYPPILAEATWRKVSAVLDDPARQAHRSTGRPRHLLSGGFLTCGLCGTAMMPKTVPAQHSHTYACDQRPPAMGCGRVRIAANGVEFEVTAQALARIALPSTRKAIVRGLELKLNGPARLRTLVAAVTAANQNGDEPETIRNLVSQRDLVEAELARAADMSDHFNDIVNLTPVALARWWDAALVEQRRGILDFLLATVTVKPAAKLGRYPGGGIDPDRLEFSWR